ncbi:MAG: polysaccharide pyruvyl transferase family protein [Lachnospirales bacterium]
MKIVYVGDNRNRMNFGCRATSTALSQILSEKHRIVGRVHGNFRNIDTEKIFYMRCLPFKAYNFLGKRKHWELYKTFFISMIHIFRRLKVSFSPDDFITLDFEKTIENLIKCIPANKVLKECDLRQYDFDALVVNGEGSFVFSKNPWREAMMEATLMYWAKKMGKKVYFLNSMFSASPNCDPNFKTIELMKSLFENIDVVSVREEQSYIFAKMYFPAANIQKCPDALFSWWDYINDDYRVTNGRYSIGHSGADDESFYAFDFTKPYICISGSSSSEITKDYLKSIDQYCKLVKGIKKTFNINVFIVVPDEIDNFLLDVAKKTSTPIITVDTPILTAGKILANATVYITGRYHPSILASLGGTPCVFMGSNSHKNYSLQETLGYENPHEYNAIPDDNEIKKILNETRIILSEGKERRIKLQETTKELSEFAKEIGSLLK